MQRDKGMTAKGQELPPVAPMLMQSLRAIGYTTAAALADLVDNAIAASARAVEIRCRPGVEAYVAVIDNGVGMNAHSLVEAMRFGSNDPRVERDKSDLGRFGLGMKTASLSQCRRLTVVSLKDGCVSLARWDLDECERRGTWWLEMPDAGEIPGAVLDALARNGSGTAVVWQVLDRFGEHGADEALLGQIISDSADHLALVFHRFLCNELDAPLEITINERPLPRIDPFLEGHLKGQTLFAESFVIDGHQITVSPFVLPYPQRLTGDELARAGGRERLKSGHGFYIYRGGRLVVPGGWHRIVPTDETVRLARIRVDIPVALDHIWKVDIRKANAEPPPKLRPHLRRIVQAAADRSRNVITFRARPRSADTVPVWQRLDGRDGSASWRVNRNHPLISALASPLDDTGRERLFRLLELELPLHAIHVHLSNDLRLTPPGDIDEQELEAMAQRMLTSLGQDTATAAALLDRLPLIDPFSQAPDVARKIADGIRAREKMA